LDYSPAQQAADEEIAIHPREDFQLDFLWADGFAFAHVGATAENLGYGLGSHGDGALIALGLAGRSVATTAERPANPNCSRHWNAFAGQAAYWARNISIGSIRTARMTAGNAANNAAARIVSAGIASAARPVGCIL